MYGHVLSPEPKPERELSPFERAIRQVAPRQKSSLDTGPEQPRQPIPLPRPRVRLAAGHASHRVYSAIVRVGDLGYDVKKHPLFQRPSFPPLRSAPAMPHGYQNQRHGKLFPVKQQGAFAPAPATRPRQRDACVRENNVFLLHRPQRRPIQNASIHLQRDIVDPVHHFATSPLVFIPAHDLPFLPFPRRNSGSTRSSTSLGTSNRKRLGHLCSRTPRENRCPAQEMTSASRARVNAT